MQVVLLALVFTAAASGTSPGPDPGPGPGPAPQARLETYDVDVVGVERNGVEMFLDVPYGQDTGGENRFSPPRASVPAAKSTIKADSPGPACPQSLNASFGPYGFSNVTHISEDCLKLNIARPKGTQAGDGLPVLIFIHGGGFWTGFKDDERYGPEALILQSVANGHAVIHVNFNYRLGVFGFAYNQALRDAGSANAGLRDQRLAIEWVRDHIGGFGGDGSKITISGESSGGMAVGMQVLAYGGTRPVPFRGAMAQSEVMEPGITGNFTVEAWARLVEKTGCRSVLPGEGDLDCLRKLDTQALYEASLETYSDDISHNMGDIWLPQVDGDFLPAAPSALLRGGKYPTNLAFVTGWCEDDMTPFVDRTLATEADARAYLAKYLPAMKASTLDKMLALYPSHEFAPNPSAKLSGQFYRVARLWRDLLMTCMPVAFAEAVARSSSDVYLYDWNQTAVSAELAVVGQDGLGVFHSSDLQYVFGNVSKYSREAEGYPFNLLPSDLDLQDRASRSWTTFAALGKPSLDLDGKKTFQGWKPAFSDPEKADSQPWNVFVAGGPHGGLTPVEGPGASEAMASEKLMERCAFFNLEEVQMQLEL